MVEIMFGRRYDDKNENLSSESDRIIRYISRVYPEATWKKEGDFWKIMA